MRRVDWPIVIGPGFRPHFTRRPSQGVVSVLAAADELVSYRDPETITRRSVELARDRLNLERVALFLRGDDDQLYGSFGTGVRGETTDERDIVFSPGESHREAMRRSVDGSSRWLVLEDVPLLAQMDERTVVVGRGWNVLTPVRSRASVAGLFVNDAALSRAHFDESKQVQLAVLATILGNLLELRRADRHGLPWARGAERAPAGSPPLPLEGALTPDVRTAMRRMCEEPTLGTAALARAAHVTPRALARHFREQVGVALVD